MDAKTSRNLRGYLRSNRWIICAFIVPFVLMVAAFAVMKVSPFGDKQILIRDLWHQYYPFLADFQSKLKHGESLFWSWTQGGGTNYMALMSYYLASPLNFLTVFVPTGCLREFLMFTVAAKIACAGMFTAIFLRSVYKRDDLSLAVFGCGFSFCAFFMGYYWNTIWLDTVCLTPLVALGTVKLLTEKRFRLYTVTLSLSLLSNYYIGLFTCIFVLLIFIAYQIVRWEGRKTFFSQLMRMGVFSIIAIGMTAFLLLPAYFALGNTHAAAGTFPTKFAINIGKTNDLAGVVSAMMQVLSNFLAFVKPSVYSAEALPNIACGTVSLAFGALFLTTKKISARERAVSVSLILFMLLSCVIRQLDYIWHGFHFTNMVPYRFAYLVSFLLVVMAFRAYTLLEHISLRNLLAGAVVIALLVLFGIGTQKASSMLATTVIAAIIYCAIFLHAQNRLSQKRLLMFLALLVTAECGITAYAGVKTAMVTTAEGYPSGGEATADVIAYMQSLEENTPELWRAEMTSGQTTNDSSLNSYNGLAMFSSMARENITQFFQNFGMVGWKAGNRYGYTESSPVTNTFMNLKYLISRDGSYSNTYDLSEVYQNSDEKLLLNEHYIPMGFMVDRALSRWTEEPDENQYNPFDEQNEFFSLATGIEEDVFSRVDVVSQGHIDHANFPVYKEDYGRYRYDYRELDATPKLRWNYIAPQDGLYCMYVRIYSGQKATIMINNVAQALTYNLKRPYIACIGQFHAGDKISVCTELQKGAAAKATVYVNRFNEDVFERGYEIISKDVMTTTAYTGTSMEGTIQVSEDGLFYTSIPYDEGWKAVVDGDKVEIEPVGGSLIAFPLSAGTHSIRLSYCPKGFLPGAVISVVSLTAFAAACMYVTPKKWNIRRIFFKNQRA